MADGKRNPAIARHDHDIIERRRNVAELLANHTTYAAMARALKVSVGTIAGDVQAVLAQWKGEAVQTIEEMRARELAELSQIEGAAAQQFAKFHHPRWLAIRLQCKERRAKLFGLDAPVRIAQTDTDGNDLPLTVREIIVRVPSDAPPVDDDGSPLVRVIGGAPIALESGERPGGGDGA